ncbi:MAG: hypothetical protein J0I20_25590 [Chloroflexi bacterium]|nr:hypothetical protein [Chloroflexota bacterium]OJW01849.1 MAG: hypothetical protein BGO39_28265 [Chloroflexi bacterium 54-19]
MKGNGTGKVWTWENRVLAILASLFPAIFSLDSFSEGRAWPEALLAFVIHNIPTYILLIILAIAWRKEWLGGLLYLVAAIAMFIWFGWGAALVILPVLIVGLLFLAHWFFSRGPGEPPEISHSWH